MGRYYVALPRVANLVLVVLIGMTFARLIWLLVPAPTPVAEAAMSNPAPAPARVDPQALIDGLAGAHLFRRAEREKPPPPVDAPETHLNLSLRGILFSRSPHYSVAIIEDGNREEHYYQPGDEVMEGVTVDAIYVDKVILAREGRYETLSLPTSRATLETTNDGSSADTATPDLAQVRSKLLQEPESITQILRMQPVYESGSLSGYRVYPGSERSVFFAVGLRPGDVVTAVNGVPLSNPAKSLAALDALRTASNVNLTLTRLGQTKNLSISLQ